jgi:hypothetical protein
MFHIFDTSSLNSRNADWAGFSCFRLTARPTAGNYNTVSTFKVTATSDSMDFSVKKLFIWQAYHASVFILQRMSFDIRVLTDAQNTTALIVDDSRHIKSLLRHLLLQQFDLQFQFFYFSLALNVLLVPVLASGLPV